MTTGVPGRLLTVVGARPQFVKAMPVSRAIARPPGLTEVMVHTGQHHDAALSDSVFRHLSLSEPAENLGIHGGSHGEMTGRMLAALDGAVAYLARERLVEAVFHVGDAMRDAVLAMAALPDRGDGVLRRLDLAGLTVIEPLGPIDMQRLLAGCPPGAHRSRLPAEGGLCSSQALCHPARRPEWSETVDAGWNRLWTVDDYRRIVATIARFLAAAQNGSRAMTGVRR